MCAACPVSFLVEILRVIINIRIMCGCKMWIIIHLVEILVWTDNAIHVGLVSTQAQQHHVFLAQDVDHMVLSATAAAESLDGTVLDAQPVQHVLPLWLVVDLQTCYAALAVAEAYLISSGESGDGSDIILADVHEAFSELDGALGARVVGSLFCGPGNVGFYVLNIVGLALGHHYPHGDSGIF